MPKILLVEDESIISLPFSIVLRSKGYIVDIAENGKEALQCCSTNAYNLILLDIMMPVCNGVEFLEEANLKVTAPQTQVVVLTNLSRGNDVEQSLELGAIEVVLKSSMTPQKLTELVSGLIG